MRKRLAAATLLSGVGFTSLLATPAMAGNGRDNDNTGNIQIVGIQTCRGIDIAGIGAAIHNILGISDESGDCVNGSVDH
ncbi:hypothetical protein [Actinomadura gamaensis]|uniref:Secreted protein n=1 Tax=Actinomadura gamaensis TaxID=1763541 RepID=A0ABV9U1S6_9ACTN